MFAASLVMIARFYVRARLMKKVALDDWVMLFAYVRHSKMNDSEDSANIDSGCNSRCQYMFHCCCTLGFGKTTDTAGSQSED